MLCDCTRVQRHLLAACAIALVQALGISVGSVAEIGGPCCRLIAYEGTQFVCYAVKLYL